MSWKDRFEVLVERSLHWHSTSLDLQFGSVFYGFYFFLEGGRVTWVDISSLGAYPPDLKVFRHQGK